MSTQKAMFKLPDHITEAEVLALIEGDMASLPPDRRDIVREAVAGDPYLSRVVGEIRADASVVISMSRVSAPSSVRARVIEDLQRPRASQVIREPEGGEIPVSSVVMTRDGLWKRFIANAPVRRLAAAAGLVLTAGLGVVLIMQAVRLGQDHASSIALNNPSRPVQPSRMNEDLTAPSQPEIAVATDAGIAESPVAPLAVDDGGATPIAATTNDRPVMADDSLDALDPIVALTPAEAVELARAGQLVIRVRALSELEAHADIEKFAVQTAKELQWRPLEPWELPQVTLALRERPYTPMPLASEKEPTRARDAMAKKPPSVVDLPQVAPSGTAADIAEALKQADFRPIYTVEMDENERDLVALLQRLSKRRSHVAEFVALEKPLPTLIPSAEPAAVLWWTHRPSEWTRRICVPIVLETIP